MSHQPKLNQTNQERKASSLPKNSGREFIAVADGPALAKLESWIESSLELLLESNSQFETRSSQKKSIGR